MLQRTGSQLGTPQPESPKPATDALEAARCELRLHVPAVPSEIARIRQAVLELAATHAVPSGLREDIALAVSEACANVVVHAYRDAAEPGTLTVEVYRAAGELRIVVSDLGAGMVPRSDSPGLGMGLALIARLAQRMEVATNGSTGARLTMVFGAPDAREETWHART